MVNARVRRKLISAGIVGLALFVFLGWFAWDRFFREVPQVFASDDMRFKYGSVGAEADRGLPYWVWLVLPRVFPDKLPGPGGWASFGLVWEEGEEVPVGFSKKTIGFERIANNCALCHTSRYRTAEDQTPTVVVAGPGNTVDVQGILDFLTEAAADPRFNADTLLAEIDQVIELSWIDRMIHRYLLIPLTRKELLAQAETIEWMHDDPRWGPGRDDPMNLTKYFMTDMPEDDSVGAADFPSIWNLGIRKGDDLLLNWSGDTPAVRSVLIDSALGLGAAPGEPFLAAMADLDDYLSRLPPPPWPYPDGPHAIDPGQAAAGRGLYEAHCASCHEPGRETTSKVVPIDEIGTDRERMDTWTQEAADQANEVVASLGIDRIDMVKNHGYVSPPLDGCWLRAPYLHNGSVPDLWELLQPPEERATVFWRGHDLYDPVRVGFVSAGPDAEAVGFRFDTSVRGNGNGGHAYGTDLTDDEKWALVEYVKTL